MRAYFWPWQAILFYHSFLPLSGFPVALYSNPFPYRFPSYRSPRHFLWRQLSRKRFLQILRILHLFSQSHNSFQQVKGLPDIARIRAEAEEADCIFPEMNGIIQLFQISLNQEGISPRLFGAASLSQHIQPVEQILTERFFTDQF